MAAKTEKIETVSMDFTTARTYRGTAYGPGEGVPVPKDAAEAFKAADAAATPGRKSAKKGKSE